MTGLFSPWRHTHRHKTILGAVPCRVKRQGARESCYGASPLARRRVIGGPPALPPLPFPQPSFASLRAGRVIPLGTGRPSSCLPTLAGRQRAMHNAMALDGAEKGKTDGTQGPLPDHHRQDHHRPGSGCPSLAHALGRRQHRGPDCPPIAPQRRRLQRHQHPHASCSGAKPWKRAIPRPTG